MYLIIDTETTGLPKSKSANISEDEIQPRIVELAWVVLDENFQEKTLKSYIIKPNGFSIPEGASSIHGLTTEYASLNGEELSDVMDIFYNDMKHCKFIVAHNLKFDLPIVEWEFRRLNRPFDANVLNELTGLCTMELTKDVCRTRKKIGSGFKNPSLKELYQYLFSQDFPGAHRAINDVRATADCFTALIDKKLINKELDRILVR